MSKRITGKKALEYAEKLKEYCISKKSCARCVFNTEYGCLIASPDSWTIEDTEERSREEDRKIEESLDRYYNNGSSFGGMG